MTPQLQVAIPATPKFVGPRHELNVARRDARDPFLVNFEKYLVEKLKPADMYKDNLGVFLFNVNQVAYLVEQSNTKDLQRATRKRISDSLPLYMHVTKRVPPSNNGE